MLRLELVDPKTKEKIELKEGEDFTQFDYMIVRPDIVRFSIKREFTAPFTLEKLAMKIIQKEMQSFIYQDDKLVRAQLVKIDRYTVNITDSPPVEAIFILPIKDL